jgi:hypothetical protein
MRLSVAGRKSPSAPPAIPPIIINPYTYQTPQPAIDPRSTPAAAAAAAAGTACAWPCRAKKIGADRAFLVRKTLSA